MKNTLVVVTDLGGFKAFRLDKNHQFSSPRLELLEQFDNPGAHGRLGDTVSDLAGRFPRSTGAPSPGGAMSDGERHNIELEWRKRLVRRLAQRLNALLANGDVEGCYLAASREINHQLLEELTAPARLKIARNIAADLTKTDKSELLRHFQAPELAGPAAGRAFA